MNTARWKKVFADVALYFLMGFDRYESACFGICICAVFYIVLSKKKIKDSSIFKEYTIKIKNLHKTYNNFTLIEILKWFLVNCID